MDTKKNIYKPEFIPYRPSIKDKHDLSTNETLCYGFIKFYAQNNDFYFSSKQFWEILDVRPATIDNYVYKLKKKGLIKTKTKRYNDGNGNIKSSRLIYLPSSSQDENTISLQNENSTSSQDEIKDKYKKDINNNKEKEQKEKKKIPYKKIIEHFNKIADRSFNYKTQTYRDKIKARRNEWYELEDFLEVHKYLYDEWTGTKYEKYLRPSTIYRKSKFPKYVDDYKYEKKKKKSASKKKKKKDVAKKEKKNTVSREQAKNILNTNKNN